MGCDPCYFGDYLVNSGDSGVMTEFTEEHIMMGLA